jgi:hypothetical protein
MLGGGRRQRFRRPTFRVRDGHALRGWLVKGVMYEAVQKEGHDQHPSSEEPEKVPPAQQVQQ